MTLTYSITQILILMVLVVYPPIILGFVEHFFFVRRYHQLDRAHRSVFEVLSGSRLTSYAIVLDAIGFYFSRWGLGMVTEVTSSFVFVFLIIVHFQLFILSLIVERKFHQYKDKDFNYALRPARVTFSLGLLSLLTNGLIVTLFVGIGDIS
jgi:hypothetical protein